MSTQVEIERIVRRGSWWGLCAVLLLGGCDCENRVRRALSDPGARGDRHKGPDSSVDQGVVVEPSSTEPEEVEPNARRAQATRYELGAELRALRASIGTTGDQDWFLIGSARDELLEVSVEPVDDALDVSVELMSSDDTPLRYEIAGAGKPEVVPWVRVQGGQALAIKITAKSGQGSYRVNFRRHLSAGALEAEPNEIWSDAMRFAGAMELQGFYDRPGDRDLFLLEGHAEQVQRLELSGLEGMRQRVVLVRDEREVWSRDLVEGQGLVLPNLGGQGWGLGLSTQEGAFSRDVPYRLKTSLVSAPDEIEGKRVMWEAEPNDPVEAQPVGRVESLSAEPLVVQGSILDEQDLDVFGFMAPGAEVVRMKLTASEEGRRVWMRLGEGDEQVWAVGAQGVERCLMIEAGRTDAIEITLGGKPARAGRAATYSFEAWSVVSGERAQGQEVEPNDTMKQATMHAGADVPWVGYVLTEQDQDWYLFEVNEAEQLIGLVVDAHELDLMLSLRDDQGGVVADVQGSGAGGQEALELRLPQGKYLVKVSSQKGSSCEPYRLSLLRK